MNDEELKAFVDKAVKMKARLKQIHEMTPVKWLIGYELAMNLKSSMYKGNTINEETFFGIPYLLDYKEKQTLLIATDPLA